jgi:hypothetical protein
VVFTLTTVGTTTSTVYVSVGAGVGAGGVGAGGAAVGAGVGTGAALPPSPESTTAAMAAAAATAAAMAPALKDPDALSFAAFPAVLGEASSPSPVSTSCENTFGEIKLPKKANTIVKEFLSVNLNLAIIYFSLLNSLLDNYNSAILKLTKTFSVRVFLLNLFLMSTFKLN